MSVWVYQLAAFLNKAMYGISQCCEFVHPVVADPLYRLGGEPYRAARPIFGKVFFQIACYFPKPRSLIEFNH